VLLDFQSTKSVTITYANLDLRTYRCTAELINDIENQFDNYSVTVPYDSILAGRSMSVSYQPFNDSTWTGDQDMINYFPPYQKVHRKVDNTDSIFYGVDANPHRVSPVYFRSRPIYYGERIATSSDIALYTMDAVDDDGSQIHTANNNYLYQSDINKIPGVVSSNLQTLSQTAPFTSYLKGNTVYEYIPIKYQCKTANIGFWQVHVYPVLWYYERDPYTGIPLLVDALKMDQKTAIQKKKESINSPDDATLKYFRNPYLSDSASVIVSFAFTNVPGVDMTTMNSIPLVDSTVNINHYPSNMYRVTGPGVSTSYNAYSTALFQLYSKDALDEARNQSIGSRCPNWKNSDLANADLIFPKSMQDPAFLVRDKNVDEGIFSYNSCPCSQVTSMQNLTAVQLKRLLYQTPPLCNRADMVKAVGLYNQMIPILTDPKDQNLIQKKISLVNKTIKERDARAAAAGVTWSTSNGDCAPTWVNNF
jgi:hypothetical protein